jgi:hypothetical protein
MLTAPVMLASSECRYNKDDFPCSHPEEFQAVLTEGSEQRKLSCLELELIKAHARRAPRSSLPAAAAGLNVVCCCCDRVHVVCACAWPLCVFQQALVM